MYQIGVEPVRIDLLTKISGVDFQEAWGRCELIQIEDLEIQLISRADLIVNKRTIGRMKDLADVEWLEKN